MARPKGAKTVSPRRLAFKQSEIERGLRAAQAHGLQVARIEIEPLTGKIIIIPQPVDSAPSDGDAKNPWDEVLKHDPKNKKRPA